MTMLRRSRLPAEIAKPWPEKNILRPILSSATTVSSAIVGVRRTCQRPLVGCTKKQHYHCCCRCRPAPPSPVDPPHHLQPSRQTQATPTPQSVAAQASGQQATLAGCALQQLPLQRARATAGNNRMEAERTPAEADGINY